MMDFPIFAQTLYPIIGAGSDYGNFVKTLLDAMTTEAASEVLDVVKKDTYKHYYYGKPTISGMARKLSVYLDEEEFVAYLNTFEDDVAIRLADAFARHIPGINKLNYSTELARYFKRILMDAADRKAKRGQSDMSKNPDQVEGEAVDERVDSPTAAAAQIVKQTIFNNNGNGVQIGENTGTINVGLR